MEVRQLRYFLAVADELSFTRAARRLHITQQSLSAAIRRLEEGLGCRLLDRTSAHVALTPAGLALHELAPAILASVDAAAAAARAAAGVVAGQLRLRYGLDSEAYVEPLLARLQRDQPGVVVRAWTGMDADNLRALRDGDVEAVFAWALDGAHPGLDRVVVAAAETRLALPAGHPLAAGGGPVAVDRLARERVALFPRDGAPTVWAHLVRALRVDPARVVDVPVSGQGAMVDLVARGEAVCPVSADLVDRLAVPGVAFRPLDPPLRVPLALAWRRPPSPALRALLERLPAQSPVNVR